MFDLKKVVSRGKLLCWLVNRCDNIGFDKRESHEKKYYFLDHNIKKVYILLD